MDSAIKTYLERLKISFPNFKSFSDGNEEFDKEERNYKIELVDLYKNTVADSLNQFPVDEEDQIALGEKITALFTTKLKWLKNQPQNLVGYRYWDPLKFEGGDNARWAKLVSELINIELDLNDRVDAFVVGLRELISQPLIKKHNVAVSALSRSVTSFLLMLADPKQHVIIKTQEFNRALKAFKEPPMSNEPLTGEEYLRVQNFVNKLKSDLDIIGIKPRDMIDVQSFIFAGDEKYGNDEEMKNVLVTQNNEASVMDKQDNLNRILYGPPGTGKTFKTAEIAVLICDGKVPELRESLMERYKELCQDERVSFVTFHQSYGYEDFVEGLRPVPTKNGQISYPVIPGIFRQACEVAESSTKNHVLIIDEINRANISKVFGELITLLEPDKRSGKTNAITVKLPYSGKLFSVPSNLYVIGTMNTADRSIALLDTALRRRFEFEELQPDYAALYAALPVKLVDGIDLGKMLRAMNERIEWLYDRDHTIGHAYFMSVDSLEKLQGIFRHKIIPLLQEYFYEDWAKVRLVLNDNDGAFIDKNDVVPKGLETVANEFGTKTRYKVKDEQFTPKAYIKIYQ